ncbi:hypothetical protein LX76_02442 [Cereibacter changlensis]|nr:hypothetical protein LX76_02442 [Cereibacter changlensis]
MGTRSHYLPSARALHMMSDPDRGAILDYHLRQIEDEISGIQSGYITVNHKGRAHYLSLARARMRRLVKLAQSFGYWEDEPEHVATAEAA